MDTHEFHPIGLMEHSTAAAQEEKAKLKKHFGRFDSSSS
jgi:hypothetical protein